MRQQLVEDKQTSEKGYEQAYQMILDLQAKLSAQRDQLQDLIDQFEDKNSS